jgi:hypothetical protein
MMKWQNTVDEISEADFNVLYLREEIACVPGGALGFTQNSRFVA